MASFYVTHHKYPQNPQYFVVNLHKAVGLVPENNPNFRPSFGVGESYWKLFVYTSGRDSAGDQVGPLVADVFSTEANVNEFVNEKIAVLCQLIDWTQQGQFSPLSDTAAPFVAEQTPTRGQTGVSIASPIVIRMQELLPGTGIDASTVSMSVDGFSVTPNVAGNKYDYTFIFSPRPIFDE